MIQLIINFINLFKDVIYSILRLIDLDFVCEHILNNSISSSGNFDVISVSSFQQEDLSKIIFVEVSLTNPDFETNISHINLQLFNKTRKIISSLKNNIGQIKTLPMVLKNVSISPINRKNLLSIKQKEWFLLQFTLNNKIFSNGKIQIEIPEKLKILNKKFFGETQSVILEKGFENAFLSNQLQVK